MFSWICPQCGRENRASDTECANCKREEAQAAKPTAPLPDSPYPEAPVAAPLPRAEILSQPNAYIPPAAAMQGGVIPPDPTPRQVEPRRPMPVARVTRNGGLPTWVLIPMFALAFLGLGALLYLGYQRFGTGKAGFTGGEVPAATTKPKASSALQRYIEVVGIRLTQDAKKKPQVKFVAVNHGNAELSDLTANVTLWASTSRSEEDSVGTFSFRINSLASNEAREITAPFKTKLKAYELPDWQNITAEIQLTAQ